MDAGNCGGGVRMIGQSFTLLPVGRWAGGPVGRWAGGPVGRWAGGPVGRWEGGAVGRWAGVLVGGWAGGRVGRWAGGPVGRWAGGPVGRWAGGPVGRWAGGPGRASVDVRLPVVRDAAGRAGNGLADGVMLRRGQFRAAVVEVLRSEEHTSELQ